MIGSRAYSIQEINALRATELACELAVSLSFRLFPKARVLTRLGLGSFATYYRQPCRYHPGQHLFKFGTTLLERIIELWDPQAPLETSGREMVRHGWDRDYGPVTPGVRIACLVAHEVCHLGVGLTYRRRKKPHGPEFKQLLVQVHARGLVREMITTLHNREDEPWLAQPLPRLEVVNQPKVSLSAFSRGDRVSFADSKGKALPGTITRVNRKSVTVQLDQDPPSRWWRVPPQYLEPLEKS